MAGEGMEEKKEEKRRRIWLECKDCGYRWRSYGKNKVPKCPKCYEARTGKKLGRSPEAMAEMRKLIKRKPKEEKAAVSEDVVTTAETEQPESEPTAPCSVPTPEPKPQPKPQEKSFFREFLGF